MATWNDFTRGQACCYAKHSAVPGISADDTEETDEDEDELNQNGIDATKPDMVIWRMSKTGIAPIGIVVWVNTANS